MNFFKKGLLLACSIAILLSGCASDEDIAKNFESSINTLYDDGVPTESEIKKIVNKYDKMSDEQKKLVPYTVKNEVEQLNNVDLTSLSNIQSMIDDYFATHDSKDNIDYSAIKLIIDKYNKCTDIEKKFIKDYNKIEELINLTDPEKAAIAAVKSLKNLLKNPDSLQLEYIKAKQVNDEYYVITEYNAQNGFGGYTSKILGLDVKEENGHFVDGGFVSGSRFLGTNGVDSSSNYIMQVYLMTKTEEVKMDVDKIQNCLDLNLE